MEKHHKETLRNARKRFFLLINPEKAKEEEKNRLEGKKKIDFPKLKKKRPGLFD